MRGIKTVFASLLAAFSANAFSFALGDLWYDPDDPGWGVSINEQSQVLFVVLFSHDQGSQPVWYVASNVVATRFEGGNNRVFEGDLHESRRGPVSARQAPEIRKVGTIRLTDIGDRGTSLDLRFTVDGREFTRSLRRQTWGERTWRTGRYEGAISAGTVSSGALACGLAPGSQELAVRTALVLENFAGQAPKFIFSRGAGSQCTASGEPQRSGSYISFNGSFSCSDGESGSIQLERVEFAARTGTVTGLMTLQMPRCTWRGGFAGAPPAAIDF